MTTKIRTERAFKDTYRLVDEAGTVLGLAMELTNGEWGLYDTCATRLSLSRFARPRDAGVELERLLLPPASSLSPAVAGTTT
jgi:hypothetical protein